MVNRKKSFALHFIISEGVGTMKGCGRMDPFSVITYHLGLFFSLFSLAASPKWMGTLEREASSELNIDESWCVIWVLLCDASQGQQVHWLAWAHCGTGCDPPPQCSSHTHFQKKAARTVVCSYDTVWRLTLPHSFAGILCSLFPWPFMA